MKNSSPISRNMKLDIVGSSTFGRDPKIMASRTFNMIMADGWLVDYCGYKVTLNLSQTSKGRGIFTSTRANALIAVVGNTVYSIKVFSTSDMNQKIYTTSVAGFLDSFAGDVFIDENNSGQIAICDQHRLYIYNYVNNTFDIANLPAGLVPTYVTYQDSYFIIPDSAGAAWFLSAPNDGLNWFWDPSGNPVFGGFETKPDSPVVTLRFPGRGNLLFVMGRSVTELWTDVGAALFPYQRNTTVNFDYGCLNPATISTEDQIVAWIGINDKSGPVLMYSTGGDVKQISTDGINYKLSQLINPSKCSAFFMKLSGHLIYQFTFYDPKDNVSFIYDFTTGKFFDVTDENMNYHIARRVAFFDNDYYFVSLNDGNLYQMDASLTTFDYSGAGGGDNQIYDIPRVRVCSNIRMPNSSRFVVNKMTFTLEQGDDIVNQIGVSDYQPRIGASISVDGGISFSSYVSRDIYKIGRRLNKLDWWGCGSANDYVPQFRFWGKGPWRATDGLVSVYQ